MIRRGVLSQDGLGLLFLLFEWCIIMELLKCTRNIDNIQKITYNKYIKAKSGDVL